MASLTDLGINPVPQYADAAYGQQAQEAATSAGIQQQRNEQLYNGFQGVPGTAADIADQEGAQGNLYSGGAQIAQQRNKQNYSYAQGQITEGLRSNLANLALNRFLTSVGGSA